MSNEETIESLEKMYPKRTQMVDGRMVGGFNDYDSPRGIAIGKAIDSLKDILAEATSSDVAVCYVTDNDAKPLGMAIEALEKQMPKKPTYEGGAIYDGEIVYDTWICPCCEGEYEVYCDDYDYCPNCGQAIDWSEVENEF